MGVDMWAAEILLRMKEQQTYQDVELCLALSSKKKIIRHYMTKQALKRTHCFSTSLSVPL